MTPLASIKKTIVLSTQEAINFINNQPANEPFGYDIEHNAKQGQRLVLAGFSLYSKSRAEAIYIPTNHPEHERPREETKQLFQALSTKRVIVFSGSTDTGLPLAQHGVTLQVAGDPWILNRIRQVKDWSGLKDQSTQTGILDAPIELDQLLPPGDTTYDVTKVSLTHPLLLDYTTQDAYAAFHLEEQLQQAPKTTTSSPDEVYQLELDVLPILGAAEIYGIRVDQDQFLLVARRLQMEADDLERDIRKALGREDTTAPEFSLNSPARVSTALFNTTDRTPTQPLKTKKGVTWRDDRDLPGLGLTPRSTPTKTTPYHQYSTATIELERIADQHPLIDDIIKWKSLDSIVSRDVTHIVEGTTEDGILHPRFQQIGKDATSRIYTSRPNVISLSHTVRDAIKPRPGKVFITVDYKAAEWRLAGLMAEEPLILEPLAAGQDPHTVTYSLTTGTPLDQVTPQQREIGKTLNFASIFGSTGYSVARALKITEGEAQAILARFWAAYPKLNEWADQKKQHVLAKGYTTTLMGRVRRLPEAFSRDKGPRDGASRQAVNTSAQSSCGDVLKQAIIRLHQAASTPGTYANTHNLTFLVPVFDAMLIEADQSVLQDTAQLKQAIKAIVEIPLSYGNSTTIMTATVGLSQSSWTEATNNKL